MKFEGSKDTDEVFTRRTILLGVGAGVGFCALAGRLYQIQVSQADRYALKSDENQFDYRLLTPSRGRILDRFGEALAENKENYTVLMIAEQAGDSEAVLDHLAGIAPLTEERRQEVLQEMERELNFRAVTVMENLEWSAFARVNLHAPELPGVQPIVGETRFYPRGDAFAHITGYVSKADPETAGEDPLLNDPTFRVGREGMEKTLDPMLRGEAGSLKVEVDTRGRVVRELPDPAMVAKPGTDVRLTLDAGLQEYAVQCLAVERTASAAVIDVRTGDILALASYPAYDPNHFARRMSSAEYKALSEDERNPLFPWATAGQYPPGSTFKPMLALAAARHGAIDPAERIHCGGSIAVGRTRKHCWKAHGAMDLHGAIKNSCDVYFYEVGRRLGIEKIAEVAREFGLGSAPEIGLPGVAAGNVPDEAWKRAKRDESWQLGDTLNVSIGQGDLTASPLQLAVMTARIASRQKILPRLVLTDDAPQFESLDFPADAFAGVHFGMRGVCEEQGGTAYYSLGGGLNFGGMEMAGKSGTSQVRRITAAERARGVSDNADLPWNRRDHALFIGYAPFDNPRYACAAVAQHGGGGSSITGPMVRDMLVYALDHNSGRSPASTLAVLQR